MKGSALTFEGSLREKVYERKQQKKGSSQLNAFLMCTLRPVSPAAKLRGMDHILNSIMVLACEEWLELHIDRFPSSCVSCDGNIPELTMPWQLPPGPRQVHSDPESFKDYPKVRQLCAGCSVATVEKNVLFPKPTSLPPGTFPHQESDYLYVNMMPFYLRRQSLPECCRQYWPMVEMCLRMAARQASRQDIGYLTIDERPAVTGTSQRRPGLHVESPGFVPLLQRSGTATDRYVPGAEHRWGGGMMMRNERVEGGIFMASNVANTTAVWNCQIRDEDGAFIGSHGDIERFRELLGPCARTLDAGELIWMTDRTPHESLPVPVQPDGTPVRRQYFRLVVGTVTAWYADHSTPNPLGCLPSGSVNVVRGDKFTLYPKKSIAWSTGDAESIARAYKLRQFYELLCESGLGHLYERFQAYGVRSVEELVSKHAELCAAGEGRHWGAEFSADGLPLILEQDDRMGAYFYDFDQIAAMIGKGKTMLEKPKAEVLKAKSGAKGATIWSRMFGQV